jgi:hypothetical protein
MAAVLLLAGGFHRRRAAVLLLPFRSGSLIRQPIIPVVFMPESTRGWRCSRDAGGGGVFTGRNIRGLAVK